VRAAQSVDPYLVRLPTRRGLCGRAQIRGRSESAEESQITVPRQPMEHNGFPPDSFSNHPSHRLRRRPAPGGRRRSRRFRLRSYAREPSSGATGSSPPRGIAQESPPWRTGFAGTCTLHSLAITRKDKRPRNRGPRQDRCLRRGAALRACAPVRRPLRSRAGWQGDARSSPRSGERRRFPRFLRTTLGLLSAELRKARRVGRGLAPQSSHV
jgi:hypothetical protein